MTLAAMAGDTHGFCAVLSHSLFVVVFWPGSQESHGVCFFAQSHITRDKVEEEEESRPVVCFWFWSFSDTMGAVECV